MRPPNRSTCRGATLIEAVFVILGIVIAISLAMSYLIYRPKTSNPLNSYACSKQLRKIHLGMTLFANDFDGLYPVPTDLSAGTAAANPQSGNSTANLYSYMIFNTYFSPHMLICPNDTNPNLVAKSDYRYGTGSDPNWNMSWQWDPSFSADITQPGANVGYGTLAILGDRKTNQWRHSLDPNFAIAADRGPKDGAWDASSHTLANHGTSTGWTGNVVFNDGHAAVLTFNATDPALFQINGDNLFRNDDPAKEADMWLGLFGATDEKTTTPYSD